MAASLISLKLKVAKAKFTLDYHVCSNNIEEEITLPRFHAPGNAEVSWIITLKPHKMASRKSTESYTYRLFDIFLTPRSTVCENLMARTDIKATQDCNDEEVIEGLCNDFPEISKLNFFSNEIETLQKIKVDKARNQGRIAFIKETSNTLTVRASIKYCVATEKFMDFDQGPVRGADRCSGQAFLADALGSTLSSGLLSDATLTVDGKVLHVHRVVLAAQSEVFRAMFTTECAEKATGNVAIQDVSLPVMELLLRYLYTGGVDPEPDSVLELMVTADKYMVAGLVQICQSRLLDALNDSKDSLSETDSALTLCNVLRASYLLDSDVPRRVAVEYLRDHVGEVLQTAAWAEFCAQHRALAGAALVDAMTPSERPPRPEPMDQGDGDGDEDVGGDEGVDEDAGGDGDEDVGGDEYVGEDAGGDEDVLDEMEAASPSSSANVSDEELGGGDSE